MRRPSRWSRERGSVLILFALACMGILALAALVIDIGLARAAQGEMQTAADAAALGALRSGDDVAVHTSAQNYGQIAFADPTGQVVEGEGASLTYDTPGLELHASQHYVSPGVVTQAVYLQENFGNLGEGDIVSGNYADSPLVPLNQLETTQAFPPHYPRADFSPLGEPNPAIPAGSPRALLVRLRRVNTILGAANAFENDPGVSSSGPALPYLFAHGAFIEPENVATGKPTGETAASYAPMRDGIAVRATAIAALRPATAVGLTATWVDGGGIAHVTSGATPFAVLASTWITIAANWQATHAGSAVTFGPNPDTADTACNYLMTDAVSVPSIGARIHAAAASAFPFAGGYLPLYDRPPLAGAGNVVIVGFAAVSVTGLTAAGATIAPALDTNGNPIVLDENATAAFYDGFAWTGPAGVPAAAGPLVGVVTADQAALAPASFLLQAPGLVR